MKVRPTHLPEVLIIEPQVFADPRGEFSETWVSDKYRKIGIAEHFVQDNFSRSNRGTLRGLHFQEPNPQGKLLTVLAGRIFDVVADVRTDSPRFGEYAAVELSAEGARQLWVPPGFAHGFCVLSDYADCVYKCTARYDHKAEYAIRWDDPDLAIKWPVTTPILSQRDSAAPWLADAVVLPRMGGKS